MKLFILFCISFGCSHLVAQQFYNRYPSTLDLHIYTTTDILESGNDYYKLETESNNPLNFHSNIRIIKTDASGAIIWIKKYDAGNDSSLEATSISKTLDNNLIVNAVLSHDNTFPGLGVTLFKIDTSGAVLWSVLFPGFRAGYHVNKTIQLPDSSYVIDAESSASLNSCVISLNTNATSATSKVFVNTVYNGSAITSMILRNNILSISFNHGEFITTDTAFHTLSDRYYNLDHTGAYFTHTITANGDYVFIDDIVAGGVLTGMCRIFRTDANGALIWAKSLTIWNSFTSHTPFTLFDVVKGVSVFEDTSLNIIAHLVEEGGGGVALTFDGGGQYMTNKVILAAQMVICSDGDFAFVSNLQFANSLSIFAKQLHYSINNCDSLIDVQVSNGTDSASTVATATTTMPLNISIANFPIYVSTTTITPTIYCPITTGFDDSGNSDNQKIIIYPDPASRYINISNPGNYLKTEIRILDLSGKLFSKTNCFNAESKIDISELPVGLYLLEVKTGNNISRQKFIKQ